MTSMTASAWTRSIRPLRKARLVNSPGSASRAPWRRTSEKPLHHQVAAVTLDLQDILAGI